MNCKVKNRFLVYFLGIVVIVGCARNPLIEIEQLKQEAALGKPGQFEMLIEIFERHDNYSGYAAIALGKLGDKRATALLTREISMDGPFAEEALIALEMLMDPRSIPPLIWVVRNNRPYADRAVRMLGEFRDDRAIPALLEVLEERRPYYLDAIEALGKIKDIRTLPVILDFFDKPLPNEPEDIQIHVVEEPTSNRTWKHTRTYKIHGESIPPRLEILRWDISAEGNVHVAYRLQDAELDTLWIVSEFSEDNGKLWLPATSSGKTSNIISTEYQNTMEWISSKDNPNYTPDRPILLKLTPTDRRTGPPTGVSDIIVISTNPLPLEIQPISREVFDNVEFSFYYPDQYDPDKEILRFQYSLNSGRNWLPAATMIPYSPEELPTDTIYVQWRSRNDLPGFDSENVQFRVSTCTNKILGRWSETPSFHLDNNDLPSVEILSINDSEFFEIEYQISDTENDNVGLQVHFSMDNGISWENATMSGDLSGFGPEKHRGIIRWYSDFDITESKIFPIRLRITPYDNDQGIPVETVDFYLKESYYSKLTAGRAEGDIEIKYNSAQDIEGEQDIEYSIDQGRTWRDASISNIDVDKDNSKKTVRLNWEAAYDLQIPLERMNVIRQALNSIADPNMVPEILLYARERNAEDYPTRQRGLQAYQLLDQKPPWIIEGLLKSLVHDSEMVRETAASILRMVDEPRVQTALKDYDEYWASYNRNQQEFLSSLLEERYYARVIQELREYRPTQNDMTNFMMRQGLTPDDAQDFINRFELFKIEKQLAAMRDRGEISQKEYERRLSEATIEHLGSD